MRRIISLFIAALITVFTLCGCNKMPAVDKNVDPSEHFSQYKTLTDLYGTPWRDVLKKLDIDYQKLDLDGLNCVGIPLQETYADMTFDTALRFRGDDNHLRGVEYTVTYQYPEEEGKLLKDLVKINRELISDFGKPSDTSLVFNWAEKKMGEQWNRDIPFWQDAQILKRLLDDHYTGSFLLWNLNSVAPEHIKVLDIEYSLGVSVYINDEEGTAAIIINY